jgi:hypothetical protein
LQKSNLPDLIDVFFRDNVVHAESAAQPERQERTAEKEKLDHRDHKEKVR